MKKRNRSLKDYTGQKFGRLTAIALVYRDKKNNHLWAFKCDCGATANKRIKSVREGHTSSCGCLQKEALVHRNTRHGLIAQMRPEYRSWRDMRARCNNPNNSDYANYGGRRISVCERWNDFAKFVEDMGPRTVGMTLDRIDPNGNYEPANCRWADAKTQANNKRTNRIVGGKTLQQISDECGVGRATVAYRLCQGYSVSEALAQEDFRRVISRH